MITAHETLPAQEHVAAAELVGDGRYRLMRHLGAGTSKEVFQAEDLKLGREVALALIPGVGLSGRARERVLREVRTVAQLDGHPHIVTVHDYGDEDGVTFVVSELVRGGSVADWIARAEPGAARIRTAVDIAFQMADALGHAHRHGVVHRDVKPSNVLLASDGTAMLADFGVALLTDRSDQTDEGVVGSAAYMPPEQAEGRPADARSDLYALGATLFEMVCGRPPFAGRPLAVMLQHIHEEPPDPAALEAGVPQPLAELILRLLAKRPADRPASAEAVGAALRTAVAEPRPAAKAAPALPASMQARRRVFVGRAATLDVLRAAWERTEPGSPSLTVLSGDAGIGKTTLANAFGRELHGDGALVLHGRCDEDSHVSYQPFIEALRHLLGQLPGLRGDVAPRYEPELAELGRLVPELRRDSESAAGAPQRYLLFEAVVALLSAAARQRPLLLVLDDLQWADRSTGLLLRHVLRATREGTLMVLGTVRTGDGTGTDPLADARSDLRRDPGASGRLEDVALAGLDESETGALVSAWTERGAAPDFIREMHETTSGNPFFINETLRHLGDSDLAAGSLASRGIPRSVQEFIQRRLERLDRATVDLLSPASVCGREFRLDVLTAVLSAPASQLVGPLDDAMSAGLVTEPAIGRFTFCHALVREALYKSIRSDTRRAHLHLAVGEAVAALDGDAAPASELALHFHAARHVGGAGKAVTHAMAAAREAARTLAYEEAARHEVRALDALELLPARRHERFGVLGSLGRLQWQAGDSDAAKDTFRRKAALAREVGDPEQLARAALGFGGRWYDAEFADHELIELLEEALAALPPGDGATRAKVMARLAQALRPTDSSGNAAGLNRQALAMARRTRHEEALIDALAGQHAALLHVRHLRERLELSAEWMALAEAPRHRGDALALALLWRIYDLFELGDPEGAQHHNELLAELAEEVRQPLYRNFATSWDFKWLEAAGRFAEAKAKAEESYRYGRRAQASYAKSLYAGQSFGLLRDQGRLREVTAVVEEVMGGNPTLAVWRTGLVLAWLDAGDPSRARAELSALVADDFAAIPRDVFWLAAMCMLAEGAAALGDEESAAALAAQLEPYADRNAQIGLALFLGPVQLFAGLLAATLGRTDEAARRLEAAIERSVAIRTRTAEIHARCAYGELLLPLDEPRARALLAHAHADATELGMAAIARRTAKGLARAA